MNELIKTWWNGNSTRLWRVLLIGYMVIISFFAKFMFERIVMADEMYARKTEVEAVQDDMQNAISDMRSEMRESFQCLRDEINDVNRYLRDSNTRRNGSGG